MDNRKIIPATVSKLHHQAKAVLKTQHKKVILPTAKTDKLKLGHDRDKNLFHIEESESSPGSSNGKGTRMELIVCKKFGEKHGEKF